MTIISVKYTHIFKPGFLSLIAWSLHLISSVGHSVKDEKKAAQNPESALSKLERQEVDEPSIPLAFKTML
jgi:hypothetical protein